MNTIAVIVEQASETPQPGTLGALSSSSRIKEIDVEQLRQSFARLSAQISSLLQDMKQVGSFQLKEVQLQVEITAEGGVALIGLAKAGMTGAITLTFSA
jgi:hypothetical protein